MNFENKANLPDKLLKSYNAAETEGAIYKIWEKSGFFNPDVCVEAGVTKPDAKPFTIMMPPPNATGSLHMGHALFLTIEDIMIRFKRMQGYRALWLPGTDHAAIATQSKVEKEIQKKEGLSRHDLGREELLKRINTFVEENQHIMTNQMRVMGASCDWSREAFTLDNVRNKAVLTVFKKMYDDGLIYRGYRIVNWDPKGQTTISDDEIVYEERESKLYTFKYWKDFPISISTTRPETKVGDCAVAVHPNDSRYKEFIGKEFSGEFFGVPLKIKIISDEGIEPEFGTGALGVTPAHSQIDWEMAQKNNLPVVPVINEYAKMTVGGPELLGKKVTEAREIIVTWLREQELLENEVSIKQNVPTAERTGGIVEPLPKLQWFIDVKKEIPGRGKSLKEIIREPVVNGDIKIIPDYFNKTYFHWIDNLRDWCISRQIWYGQRIPVWYRGEEIFCGIEAPTGEGWIQDEDTLDTWFSSGMWTFSALGWPEKTKDFETYHPTDVLETGADILPFWVMRMILMTEYTIGTIPFKTVYLHGMVRNSDGQKMSKSLGNNLDPLDIAQKFGADAGRMALVVGTAPGTDSKIDENKIKAYSKFANKLWNIARFILENCPEGHASFLQGKDIFIKDIPEFNNWGVWGLIKEVTQEMEEYKFHIAAEKIYHFTWHQFADKILEESKIILNGTDEDAKKRIRFALYETFENILKLLHPFMPFVTEEIWSLLRDAQKGKTKSRELLIIESWPV